LECDILEETDEGYKVSFHVTKSIIDEKVVPHSTIAKIIKSTPDQRAYEKLKDLLPTRDLTPLSVYDDMIDNRVRVFNTTYPGSPYEPEVAELLEALELERDQVSKGYRKLDGEWISPEVYKRREYQIEASIAHRNLVKKVGQQRFRQALIDFEQLEEEFGASMAYPEAVETALGALKLYDAKLNSLMVKQPIIAKMREDGLKRQTVVTRPRTVNAINEEIAKFEATRSKEEERGVQWKTVYPYDMDHIEEARASVEKEAIRLEALDLEALRSSSKHTADALEHFADKEFIKAAASLAKASEAGADEQFIEKLKERVQGVQDNVEERMESVKIAEEESTSGLRAMMRARIGEGVLDTEPAPAATDSAPKKVDEPVDKKPEPAPVAKKPESKPKSAPVEAKGGLAIKPILFVAVPILLVLLLFVLLKSRKKSGDEDDE